jgi:uridine kinase
LKTSPSLTVLAIAGASASGKTLLAQTMYQELRDELGSEIDLAILAEDAYYRDQSHLPMAERELTNYDHPDAFEHELLVQHLEDLAAGKAVEIPAYDFSKHTRVKQTRCIQPAKVVIVEGILLLSDARLCELFDIKVFVDTPLDICLLRRIKRDLQERGRTLDSITAQYNATVRPMYFEFIAPSRAQADLVVTRGGKNRIAIDVLKQKISALIAAK